MSRTEMLREVRMLRGAGALPLATPLLGRRQGLIPRFNGDFPGVRNLTPTGPTLDVLTGLCRILALVSVVVTLTILSYRL